MHTLVAKNNRREREYDLKSATVVWTGFGDCSIHVQIHVAPYTDDGTWKAANMSACPSELCHSCYAFTHTCVSGFFYWLCFGFFAGNIDSAKQNQIFSSATVNCVHDVLQWMKIFFKIPIIGKKNQSDMPIFFQWNPNYWCEKCLW